MNPMYQRTRTPLRGLWPICAALLGACQGEADTTAAAVNTYTVTREDLPITVKESGELVAMNETVVRSDVEGQSTIISLIPEGSRVEKGQKLVELDVSELVEKRANQEIAVEKARNALEQARTQKDILEQELRAKENTAVSLLKIAEMEVDKLLGATSGKGSEGKNADMVRKLEELVTEANDPEPIAAEDDDRPGLIPQVHPQNYAGLLPKVVRLLTIDGDAKDPLQRAMGEMANKILQQADQIRLAMADLKVKEDTYTHSWHLQKKQFITRNELERDQLAYQSQSSKVTIAWNDLELLINYTLERDKIELTQNRENARLELARVQASNDAQRKNSQFDVDAKEKEFQVATERLANLKRQIDNATIYAPGPGLVVYARVENRRSSEGIQEGTQVRERQALIILPDNSRLQCVVKVQEAQVDKVAVGQPAHISVEAFPTEILTGRVTRVAPVADSSNSWMGNDKKVYTTVVELDGLNNDERLKSRMAAAATITVGTVHDVLTVPIQAVRRDRSVNYVWKKTPQGPVAVAVKVGAHNQEKVEVLDGVAEGDVVYRTPPGGQPDPKFDQPALPEAPTKPAAGTGAPVGAGDTIRRGDAGGPGDGSVPGSGPGSGPGSSAGDGNGTGSGPGGNRGPGRMGGPRKRLPDMSSEELAQEKERMTSMSDRMRSMLDEETAAKYEKLVGDIVKAIDENRLEDAQTLRDSMRSLFPRRPGGGREGGGPGGGRGSGDPNGG